ncbi:hypothetical protein RHSIM_Rhsim04G0061300 [Rhododendron simsii]|uniref:PB1 domain-containing protein n=1 Tax=Rhododendron simsii TaxID=118357 RepID=A0A834H1Y6_RHOSS|nr:hypothetical protein RHSIM_Rhsim04G0061300 [Rhododendron simsii]
MGYTSGNVKGNFAGFFGPEGFDQVPIVIAITEVGVSGGNEDVLGLPGRVFRGRLPESSRSIHHYSSKEWPRQDEAMECGVCVGVMEMTSSSKLPNLFTEQSSLSHHFLAPTLTCFDIASPSEPWDSDWGEDNSVIQPHIEGVRKPEHEFASKKRKPHVVLTPDDMKRCKGMRQVDAMKLLNADVASLADVLDTPPHSISLEASHWKLEIGLLFVVSKATFRTNLKNLKLPKWSLCKDDPSLFIESTSQPSKGKNPAMKSSHGKKSAESVEPRKEIIKAKGPDDAIRFQMSYPVKLVALELAISKRMKINVGAFLMKYEDGDAEKIRITNDEDVQLWIETCKVLEMREPVVFVVPNPSINSK